MHKMHQDTIPTHTILLAEQIYSVAFSPYEWSQNLLCIALLNKITVASIRFQVIFDMCLFFMIWFLLLLIIKI